MFGMRRRSSSPRRRCSVASSISCKQALAGRRPMQSDQLKRREFITLLGINDLTRGGSDENAA
jgi:hypothetical protein